MRRKKIWRIWAKALGEKSGSNDKEADIIAIIRTFIFLAYMITNIAIISNAVRHWNNNSNNKINYNNENYSRNY